MPRRGIAFKWVRVLHLIIIYRPPRMGQPIFWCERGDSIALWCKRRPAGVWQCPAGALHLSGFESPLEHKNIGRPVRGSRYWGAREGTRLHFPLCGKSRLLPVFELAAADVHRTSAFQWVRVPFKSKSWDTQGVSQLFGAREGTRTPTGLPHAPQTCLSTIPTLSQVLGYCILFSLFCQSFFTGWDGRFSR